MNKFKEIKLMLTNREVVEKYLGTPVKRSNTGNWYKSPFRIEKTASFCVSNKGIHDFGDSQHYDIISFVSRYFNVDNSLALEILSRDFNINISNEYETKETIKMVKRNRELERQAKEKVDNWFNETFNELCDKILINNKCLEYTNKFHNPVVLKHLYDENIRLELQYETFCDIKEEDRPKLYLEYNRR